MVDLLATNLRGVAGINTVDPRNVLRTWGDGDRGANDLRRALDVGRDLEAGSVVLGSVVSTGGRVRLAADIYSVEGDRLARAQVDGAADSVLGVVDRLSLALFRDIWRSKEPLPNLRLASLTSDSIGALREYLQGEGYYRKARLGLGAERLHPSGGDRLDVCARTSPPGAGLRLDRWIRGRGVPHRTRSC